MLFRKSLLLTTLFCICVIGIVGAGRRVRLENNRADAPRPLPASLSADPPGPQRTMRALWTFALRTKADIDDVVYTPTRIYYITAEEVGCVDKATGHSLWQHTLAAPIKPYTFTNVRWRMSLSGKRLYASELMRDRMWDVDAKHYRLVALDVETGKPVWERPLPYIAGAPPQTAAGRVLLALLNGQVMAFHAGDGTPTWQRRMSVAAPAPKSYPTGMALQTEGESAVMLIGDRHLFRFRADTGAVVWSRPSAKQEIAESELQQYDLGKIAIQGGVVYSVTIGYQLRANDLQTGAPLYKKAGEAESASMNPLCVSNGLVVGSGNEELVAAQQKTGKLLWSLHGNYTTFADSVAAPGAGGETDDAPTVYATIDLKPVLDNETRSFRSLRQLENVVAFNARTGHERWHWQIEQGGGIHSLQSEGERLYVCESNRLSALLPGAPEPLPTDPQQRRQLARSVMRSPYSHEPVGNARAQQQPPLPASIAARFARYDTVLLLLRLGKDSVPPLMDYIRSTIAAQESKRSLPVPVSDSYNGELDWAFDLLFDLNAPEVDPPLIQLLDHTKNPNVRGSIAAFLIRRDEQRALLALFRYAQTCGENEEHHGLDAFSFVCRFAPEEKGSPDSVSQKELTAYFLTHLKDPKAPLWLRRMATFTLLDNRGAEAKTAALSVFHQEPTAPLLATILNTMQHVNPVTHYVEWNGANTNSSLGGLEAGAPEVVVKDETGRWWGIFNPGFGGEYLWFVQSTDRVHWTQPTCGLDMSRPGVPASFDFNFKLSYRNGTFHIDWTQDTPSRDGQTNGQSQRQADVARADLYRDTDHDGIPDLMERALGTDPTKPDSYGSGLSDANNKNPLYRPHALSQDEAILQASIEALCQFDRNLDPHQTWSIHDEIRVDKPIFAPDQALIFAVPSDSKGVRILGHPTTVLCYPITDPRSIPYRTDYEERGHFTPPFVGLDGRCAENTPAFDEPPPPTLQPPKGPLTFHDYFPYQLSADGTLARVGFGAQNRNRYDIEVRKVGGEWLPVECRPIHIHTSMRSDIGPYTWTAVAPIRRSEHP